MKFWVMGTQDQTDTSGLNLTARFTALAHCIHETIPPVEYGDTELMLEASGTLMLQPSSPIVAGGCACQLTTFLQSLTKQGNYPAVTAALEAWHAAAPDSPVRAQAASQLQVFIDFQAWISRL
jgi:hypothetical protein